MHQHKAWLQASNYISIISGLIEKGYSFCAVFPTVVCLLAPLHIWHVIKSFKIFSKTANLIFNQISL